jgi:SAM-dependent methyltransferase
MLMHCDVVDLREFYARALGAVVRRIVGHRVRARWRDVRGMRVLGVGFAAPYLNHFRGEARMIAALMPAEQGVTRWPGEGPCQSALVEADALPLPDASVDRILVVHGLETAENARAMLAELWRVMAGNGRILIVAPNRRGLWARFDATPFGQGRPFSRGQLTRLLVEARFAPLDWSQALYLPPVDWPLLLRWATPLERIGAALWPVFSGVVMIEAGKQVYARPSGGAAEPARRPRLAPMPQPVAQRVSIAGRTRSR